MMAVNVNALKAAARGRWPEILATLGGIDAELLDGRHHPCPKCGGTDRFRLIDAEAGAIRCNQCGSDIGDGIGSIQWATGQDFCTVAKQLANHLGMHPSANGHAKTNGKAKQTSPIDSVDWSPNQAEFLPTLLAQWCATKPPITVAAAQAFGARFGRWPRDKSGTQCIAFAGRQTDADGAAAVLLYQVNGQPFPAYWSLQERKTHLVGGSKESWLWPGTRDDLAAAEVVLKCEGLPDALAAYSIGLPPGWLPLTNACGAKSANPAKLDFTWATDKRVVIVGDADQPGQEGARLFAAAFSVAGAAEVRVVLPFGDVSETHGKDLRDWINEGHGIEELRALIDATPKVSAEQATEWARKPRGTKKKSPSAPSRTDVPEIIVGVDESRVVDEAIAALATRDDIFQRGGMLCEALNGDGVPGVRSNGNCRIAAVRLPRLQEMLADAAVWLRLTDGEDDEPEVVHPPAWAVKAVDARGQWRGIRPLTGIVEAPTIRPDGSVLQEPGYDRQTGLIYRPSCEYPAIPALPTRDDARRAVEQLLEVVEDFPFASDVHRAAWLAFVLTLIGRESFDGCAPATLIDANTRGSGKSLLVDVASIIATGRDAPRMTFPRDEDELRKRITSVVMAGLRLVMIDNTTRLGGDALDAALTATTWQDRVLGRSEITTLPISMTWCATGNNVQVLGDTIRRVLPVRIETRDELPEERTGFHHPDLRAWVAAERGRLAAAAVTILAGYAAAGRPDMRLTPWGSFEGWSGSVRSAVVWAGQPDPAGNRRELLTAADTEGALLRRLLAGWSEIDPSGRGLTVGEAMRRLGEFSHEFGTLRSALEEITPPSKPLSPRSLGMRLHHLRGRVVGGRCFDFRDTPRDGRAWRVVSVEADRGESQRGECETNETNDTKANPHTHAPTDAHAGTRTRDLDAATGSVVSVASVATCGHSSVVETPTHDGYLNLTCASCGERLGCRKAEAAA